MSSQAKQAVYTKWRASAQSGRGARFLVAFDTIVKPPEVVAAPLVVNFGESFERKQSQKIAWLSGPVCRPPAKRRRLCSASVRCEPS